MKKAIYLSIQYMKQQKGRTFSLIIGIALAVMLVFTLTVIPETESKVEIKKAYETYADYHVEFFELDKSKVDGLKNEKGIRDMFEIFNLGSIVDKSGVSMSLNSSNKDYIKEYGYTLQKGNLPQNENEIVLDAKALEAMGIEEKIGQNIDFTIEKHYEDENGENKIFNKPYTFKLVGIISKSKDYYEKNQSYILNAYTYYEEGMDNFIPLDLIKCGCVLSIGDKAPSMNKVYEVMNKHGIVEGEFLINAGLIQILNQYKLTEPTMFDIKNKLLPMLTSALVIYNIFNMILIDMTGQIGILKAIGASKKHIRTIIFFQSISVLITGTLIGLLAGLGTSYIGMATIYKEFVSIYISKNSMIIPILMASVTVLTASIIPIYTSGKISPIEAIRKTDISNCKQKNRFYHKLINKVFGLTGEMAYKNVWRNKVRSILSIVAISLGGSLFISTKAINNDNSIYEKTSMLLMEMGDIDIKLKHNKYNTDNSIVGYTNKDIKNVSKIKNIKSIEESDSLRGYIMPKFEDFEEEYTKCFNIVKDEKVLEKGLWLQGYNNESIKSFSKYIEKGSNNLNTNNGKYPKVLVYDHYVNLAGDRGNDKKIFKNLKVGELLNIKVPVIKDGQKTYENATVEVAGTLNRTWGRDREGGYDEAVQVVIPNDELQKITQKNTYNQLYIKINKGTDKQVNEDLDKIIDSKSYKEIDSKYGRNQIFEEQEIRLGRIVLLTVSLILIISALNILCTIKTNLLLRINEFATLRAVGMSLKKLKSMIMKEALIYGVLGGIIAGLAGTHSYYKYVRMTNQINESGFGTANVMKFNIPIVPIMQYMSVCIIICVVAVLLAKKKIEKLSIVEGLRNND